MAMQTQGAGGVWPGAVVGRPLFGVRSAPSPLEHSCVPSGSLTVHTPRQVWKGLGTTEGGEPGLASPSRAGAKAQLLDSKEVARGGSAESTTLSEDCDAEGLSPALPRVNLRLLLCPQKAHARRMWPPVLRLSLEAHIM